MDNRLEGRAVVGQLRVWIDTTEIADFVKEDRMVRGELCCRELYKVYRERRSRELRASSHNKLAVQPSMCTKPVPYDDLDSSGIMLDFSSPGAEY
jgi:hypothetical protein